MPGRAGRGARRERAGVAAAAALAALLGAAGLPGGVRGGDFGVVILPGVSGNGQYKYNGAKEMLPMYIPKKCHEPMNNLGFALTALYENPPNLAKARSVYLGEGGGSTGKSLQEFAQSNDSALSEYGQAHEEYYGAHGLDKYILELFDPENDFGVPPGTPDSLVLEGRVSALEVAIGQGIGLKLIHENIKSARDLSEHRGNASLSDEKITNEEALRFIDLAACQFFGGGRKVIASNNLLLESGIERNELSKYYNVNPEFLDIVHTMESFAGRMCQYHGVCLNPLSIDWEGYDTLGFKSQTVRTYLEDVQTPTDRSILESSRTLNVIPYHGLVHAAATVELALMPAAYAAAPEAWIVPAITGSAYLHLLEPQLALHQGGKFANSAATLRDFFTLKQAAPKPPTYGAYCTTHHDVRHAFHINHILGGEIPAANNIICTPAGNHIPAKQYMRLHEAETHDVRYFFENARQLSRSAKGLYNLLWKIYKGRDTPGYDYEIKDILILAWQMYSAHIEKYAIVQLPNSAYYNDMATHFASEGGGAWQGTFMTSVMDGSLTESIRHRKEFIEFMASDAIPSKLVIGLAETALTTPCSSLEDDDDIFAGSSAVKYVGPDAPETDNGGLPSETDYSDGSESDGSEGSGGSESDGSEGSGGSGRLGDKNDKRRALLQACNPAQSSLLSKIWDEAAHIYFGGGRLGHHLQQSGMDKSPYSRAEEYGRLFGTMEGEGLNRVSKAAAFIMDAFNSRVSSASVATIRKHVMATYAQILIHKLYELDLELAKEKPDVKKWPQLQAQGSVAWRILQPVAASNAADRSANEDVSDLSSVFFIRKSEPDNNVPPSGLSPSRFCFAKEKLPGMLGLKSTDLGELEGTHCLLCSGGKAVGECVAKGNSASALTGVDGDSEPPAGAAAGGILGGGAVLVAGLAAGLLAREKRRAAARAAADDDATDDAGVEGDRV